MCVWMFMWDGACQKPIPLKIFLFFILAHAKRKAIKNFPSLDYKFGNFRHYMRNLKTFFRAKYPHDMWRVWSMNVNSTTIEHLMDNKIEFWGLLIEQSSFIYFFNAQKHPLCEQFHTSLFQKKMEFANQKKNNVIFLVS